MDKQRVIELARKAGEVRGTAKQATSHETLIKQILDSRVPKTEREHAAAREIERLSELTKKSVSIEEYKHLQRLVTNQGIRLMEYETEAPEPAVGAEPVAYIGTDGSLNWLKKPEVLYSKAVPLYTHPSTAAPVLLNNGRITQFADGSIGIGTPPAKITPAVVAQEPVAWMTFDGEGGYEYRSYAENEGYADQWAKRNPNHVGWVKPLYTHPSPAVVAQLVEAKACIHSAKLCEFNSMSSRHEMMRLMDEAISMLEAALAAVRGKA